MTFGDALEAEGFTYMFSGRYEREDGAKACILYDLLRNKHLVSVRKGIHTANALEPEDIARAVKLVEGE